VLLARVSTHARSQDASNPRQIADLRDVARRKGWTVAATFSDRVSGAETGPGLRAALALICFQAKADLLAVTAIDRLGRDVIEMLVNVDRIRDVGGHFFVRDDEIDTSSPEGRMHFTLLASLAEFQRRSNKLKVYAGLDHARKKGVVLGARATWPAAARARALELRQRRRPLGYRAIAARLEAEGFGKITRDAIGGYIRRRRGGVETHPKSPLKKPVKKGPPRSGRRGR
jgi:DNA invertase Pin-like site-specific DNA recombinase